MEIVKNAIEESKRSMPEYWQNTLKQRSISDMTAGSRYNKTPEEVEKLLLTSQWIPYDHPAVKEPGKAYKAPIPGFLGVIPLSSLPPYMSVTLDDRKDTGKVSAVVEGVVGKEVPFSVIIIGPHEGKTVVWTFHPGDPITPSQVDAHTGLHGKEITVKEALKLGLEYGKVK